MANSLVKGGKKQSFSVFLTQDAIKKKINEVIGGKGGQRFMTAILSAVTNSPALQECDSMSILNCAFLGEALNLSPSPQLGQYYMVPYKKKDRQGNVISGHGAVSTGVQGVYPAGDPLGLLQKNQRPGNQGRGAQTLRPA